MWLFTYANYALTFWFGGEWVLRDRACSDRDRDNQYDPGDLIIVSISHFILFSKIAYAHNIFHLHFAAPFSNIF